MSDSRTGSREVLGPTHVNGALAAGAVSAAVWGLDPLQLTTIAAASSLAAGLPDEDRVVNDGPNHRSLTHSVAFAAVVAAFLLAYVSPRIPDIGPAVGSKLVELPLAGGLLGEANAGSIGEYLAALMLIGAIGLAIGYFSHLLLDALTPAGVWILLPGGPRFSLPLVSKVGNATEDLFDAGFRLCAAVGVGVVLVRYALRSEWLHGLASALWMFLRGLV